MRKLSMFFLILAIGLLFVSCATLPIDGNGNGDDITNQVVINTFIGTVRESVEFLAYQDGKDGTWKKLSSTNGVYTFTPESVDGNFSIYAVNEWYDSWNEKFNYDIQIMNLNTTEGKEVPITFGYWPDTYDATLNLNFGSDFIGKNAGTFYGTMHGFPWFNTVDDLIWQLPKIPGTYDLVVLAGDQGDHYSKIYIERDRTITAGTDNEDISWSDFTDLTTYIATTTTEDADAWGELLVGGTTPVFTWYGGDSQLKIPQSLSSSDDLYALFVDLYDCENNIYKVFIKYTDYPSDIEILNTLPSSTWEKPVFSENTFTWNQYDPQISNHELRFYNTSLANTDWIITWDIVLSSGWLGSANSYEYEIPDLSGLEGWNASWYPDSQEVDSYHDFEAVSGTEDDLTKYLDPIAGMEESIVSY
ncbi:hypothetical protein HWHPT5561_02055 [Petrotoga sp. HWH.PT.55.6.1]|uniref:hypothetical protein n=1 Tax=unclassified Petrotoga TaxID=2620614 RepID=UPI000CA0867D|nr:MULTISPECIES: hypothetical protein [unclassified Petrotoga]PNR94296.1 hypothetical protein X926_00645 [Petrotoga sp. HWHPT.55.6.3]RPD36369.1 hypothetical protein HWHPT5561_02055 [Petrotoga sp. HWH.PT.55.6.1]